MSTQRRGGEEQTWVRPSGVSLLTVGGCLDFGVFDALDRVAAFFMLAHWFSFCSVYFPAWIFMWLWLVSISATDGKPEIGLFGRDNCPTLWSLRRYPRLSQYLP